ncbi:MAG: histidine phosphatase family protein [Chloroflexi bacterium]|nr:histidine phosphatase family protein [Chloroflexota bacterium]
MFLYLIRHGQSYVNLEEWTDGNKDMGLTPLGQQQAASLAEWVPVHIPRPDALYCSTMKRARETAAPLAAAYELEPHFDDRVREIGNNQRNHDPFPNDQLPYQYADFWSTERPFAPVSTVVENVEALIHFRARVGTFIEELLTKHEKQSVMVVCHGGVIDMVFDHIFDVGMWRRCEVWTPNTAVSCFEYVDHPKREKWRLHFANSVAHLR